MWAWRWRRTEHRHTGRGRRGRRGGGAGRWRTFLWPRKRPEASWTPSWPWPMEPSVQRVAMDWLPRAYWLNSDPAMSSPWMTVPTDDTDPRRSVERWRMFHLALSRTRAVAGSGPISDWSARPMFIPGVCGGSARFPSSELSPSSEASLGGGPGGGGGPGAPMMMDGSSEAMDTAAGEPETREPSSPTESSS